MHTPLIAQPATKTTANGSMDTGLLYSAILFVAVCAALLVFVVATRRGPTYERVAKKWAVHSGVIPGDLTRQAECEIELLLETQALLTEPSGKDAAELKAIRESGLKRGTRP